MFCHVVMLIPHALLTRRIDRAPPSSVSLLFCAFTLCILLTKISPDKCPEATTTSVLSNFFKTRVVKDFLRIIWVNIGRIFVGNLGENCQNSLVFCGYDDWRSDKAENYTRRGTVPKRVKSKRRFQSFCQASNIPRASDLYRSRFELY